MSVDAAAEEQFGPYLVYERLGVGGMATVHRALEQGAEGFERIVALKRLLPHLAEDASFIKSFVREAKLASILNHLNIVQIYELGRVGTEYFISMEYIDGRDLRRILRHARKVTGPPPIHITAGLIMQLCDALDYAHNKADDQGHPLGLVHRDISPSNLIVTSGGHLKIIDFGIAKAQSSQLRTQTGRVKGKLAYMAPEAVAGRDLDARSDVWAAGVILHELLTARPLFASKNEYQTLLKVQRGDIAPPSTFNQACQPEVDAIVARALARDPDDRYATAAELREALLGLKQQYGLPTEYRDIASWLDWAFGLETPQSFANSPDTSGVSAVARTPGRDHHKTPLPRRNTEEEEAVEVVWGGGNAETEDGPVVLEEVPDVSEKHHRAKRDSEDDSELDDIPTPPPRFGTMPSIYGDSVAAPLPKAPEPLRTRRTSTPVPTVPSRSPSGSHPVPRSIAGQHHARTPTGPLPAVGKAEPSMLPRTTRQTSPGLVRAQRNTGQMTRVDAPQLGDRLAAQRARDSEAPPVQSRPRTETGSAMRPAATRLGSETDVREPDEAALHGMRAPAGDQQQTDLEAVPLARDPQLHTEPTTGRHRRPSSDPGYTDVDGRPLPDHFGEQDLVGIDPIDPLAVMTAADDATATALRPLPDRDHEIAHEPTVTPLPNPSVPVVRFSRSHTIPPISPAPHSPAPHSPAPHSPAPHSPAPHSPAPPRSIYELPPATDALPLAPEPEVVPSARAVPVRAATVRAETVSRTKAPSNIRIGETIAARAQPKRTGLLVLGGVVLAGGVVTVALMLGRDNPPTHPSDSPSTLVNANKAATVRFVTEPTDAEIHIGGKPLHTGSPWQSELVPGTHQIEIRRTGYKSWLTSLDLSAAETQTLRVVLEPLTSRTGDASLTITSTPPGLEVTIDGRVQAQRTPFKSALNVGSHKIALRQNGVEVWQQSLAAEASSDYEFNPAVTEDKLRARAQRASRPASNEPEYDELMPGRITEPVVEKPEPTPPPPAPITTPAITAPGEPPSTTPTIKPPLPSSPSVASTDQTAKPGTTTPIPAPQATKPTTPSLPPGPVTAPKQNVTATVAPAPTALPKRPAVPVIVPPTAVRKLSGEPPSIEKLSNFGMPTTLAAKVCIDEVGTVATAEMVTKVQTRVANDVTASLRTWRYAPHKLAGTAVPACFVVTFRVK